MSPDLEDRGPDSCDTSLNTPPPDSVTLYLDPIYGSIVVIPTTHVGEAVIATPMAIEFRDMPVKCASNTPVPGVDSRPAKAKGEVTVPTEVEYPTGAGPDLR